MEESNIPSFNIGDLIGKTITHELVQDLNANNPLIDDDVKKEIEYLILTLNKSKIREDKIDKLLNGRF
jgi:hypothetical protein